MERQTANKKDLLLILVLLLIAAVMGGIFLLMEDDQPIAGLSIDGRLVELYDLSAEDDRLIDLREDYNIPVILEIKDGAIRFRESVCPDHLCENYGYISKVTETAVCMPNRTVLTVYSASDGIEIDS